MPAVNRSVTENSPDPVANASTRDTPQVEPATETAPATLAPSSFAPDLGKALAEAMIAANQARVTPASATPGMNETRQGGMFIVGGQVVDANGVPIKDAPAETVSYARQISGQRAVSQEMEPA